MIHLILAEESDLGAIATMARDIWNLHYVPMIGQEQVDYMLDTFYNQQNLEEQMHKGHRFYLIRQQEETLGFLSVSQIRDRHYFLHKLYIYTQKANAGAGTEVLHELIKMTDPKSLTLTVNRQNYKSINFYFKNGFKIKSVEDFDIGNGYEMNDFVMVRQFEA
jgi:RimJ/RimL family protein N-acetyltransferase